MVKLVLQQKFNLFCLIFLACTTISILFCSLAHSKTNSLNSLDQSLDKGYIFSFFIFLTKPSISKNNKSKTKIYKKNMLYYRRSKKIIKAVYLTESFFSAVSYFFPPGSCFLQLLILICLLVYLFNAWLSPFQWKLYEHRDVVLFIYLSQCLEQFQHVVTIQ